MQLCVLYHISFFFYLSEIQQLCWFAVACSVTFMVGVTIEKAKFDFSSYQIKSNHIISYQIPWFHTCRVIRTISRVLILTTPASASQYRVFTTKRKTNKQINKQSSTAQLNAHKKILQPSPNSYPHPYHKKYSIATVIPPPSPYLHSNVLAQSLSSLLHPFTDCNKATTHIPLDCTHPA